MNTTTVSIENYKELLNNYSSILEKTNNQLGLGLSLSTFLVSILSIIIALLAIAVAFYIWKNSKEQKDKWNEFLSEQERVIKEKNERDNKFIEERNQVLDTIIEKNSKKLEKVNKDAKKEIQKTIDELTLKKFENPLNNKIGLGNNTDNIFSTANNSISGTEFITCPYCRYSFFSKKNSISSLLDYNPLRVNIANVCPRCNREFL